MGFFGSWGSSKNLFEVFIKTYFMKQGSGRSGCLLVYSGSMGPCPCHFSVWSAAEFIRLKERTNGAINLKRETSSSPPSRPLAQTSEAGEKEREHICRQCQGVFERELALAQISYKEAKCSMITLWCKSEQFLTCRTCTPQ